MNKQNNILYEKESNLPVVIINNVYNGTDNTNTNIQGSPEKLLNLGWTPTISIDDILDELSLKI